MACKIGLAVYVKQPSFRKHNPVSQTHHLQWAASQFVLSHGSLPSSEVPLNFSLKPTFSANIRRSKTGRTKVLT